MILRSRLGWILIDSECLCYDYFLNNNGLAMPEIPENILTSDQEEKLNNEKENIIFKSRIVCKYLKNILSFVDKNNDQNKSDILLNLKILRSYVEGIPSSYNDEKRIRFLHRNKNITLILEEIYSETGKLNQSIIDTMHQNDNNLKGSEVGERLYESFLFSQKKYFEELVFHEAALRVDFDVDKINTLVRETKEIKEITEDQSKILIAKDEELHNKEKDLDLREKNLKENENQVEIKLKQAENDRQDLSELKNELVGKYAEKVYSRAAEKYFADAEKMTTSLYATIILGAIGSILLFIFSPIDLEHLVNPILQKIFYASIFTLLVTFFLRRSTNYNRLAFQAQQTSLELEALPFFMRNVDPEKQQEIYTNLAEKYFGKSLDQTQNDKIGDLIQDQAKMSIDIAKATTEMVKGFQESAKNNSETKP